jgi:hypothetical protein
MMSEIYLYDDIYAQITSELEFLECDAKTAADGFQEWQQRIRSRMGIRLKRRAIAGELREKITYLLPLTSVERVRSLFVPTASQWTAYFDNGWRGTDPSAVRYLSSQIRCRAIRAVCVPHTIRKTPAGELGRYGATIFELRAADSRGCYSSNHVRAVYATNDGGPWCFGAFGDPLDFEQLDQYKAPRVRDRFTPAMLDAYLRNLGLRFFSPDFYNVVDPALLISREGPYPEGVREYSLEEARAHF